MPDVIHEEDTRKKKRIGTRRSTMTTSFRLHDTPRYTLLPFSPTTTTLTARLSLEKSWEPTKEREPDRVGMDVAPGRYITCVLPSAVLNAQRSSTISSLRLRTVFLRTQGTCLPLPFRDNKTAVGGYLQVNFFYRQVHSNDSTRFLALLHRPRGTCFSLGVFMEISMPANTNFFVLQMINIIKYSVEY